jgi:hypothetical protein
MTIGGSEFAGQATATGLVDECHLFLNLVVGGGKRALPDHVRADLELVNERRFKSGVVYLHYRTRPDQPTPAANARFRSGPCKLLTLLTASPRPGTRDSRTITFACEAAPSGRALSATLDRCSRLPLRAPRAACRRSHRRVQAGVAGG